MILKDALELFEGQLLSDGAHNWSPENLIEAIEEEDPDVLQRVVYASEEGIREIGDNGYLGRYLYTVAPEGDCKENM